MDHNPASLQVLFANLSAKSQSSHATIAWSEEENAALILMERNRAAEWKEVASHFPGKTEREVQNRWEVGSGLEATWFVRVNPNFQTSVPGILHSVLNHSHYSQPREQTFYLSTRTSPYPEQPSKPPAPQAVSTSEVKQAPPLVVRASIFPEDRKGQCSNVGKTSKAR